MFSLVARPNVLLYVAQAQVIEPIVEMVQKKVSIHDLITQTSQKYGIERESIRVLVGCETGWTFDPSIQSHARYKNGERERSFGLAQIHAPAHKDITYEQMTDPAFALEWLAKHWNERHQQWVNCTQLYDL